jgi:hypothetical protein
LERMGLLGATLDCPPHGKVPSVSSSKGRETGKSRRKCAVVVERRVARRRILDSMVTVVV